MHVLLIFGECRLGLEQKESMNDILIHASQALPQAHKIQISHAHAYAQTLATYSSDFVLFECGRFVRLFRIKANA